MLRMNISWIEMLMLLIVLIAWLYKLDKSVTLYGNERLMVNVMSPNINISSGLVKIYILVDEWEYMIN